MESLPVIAISARNVTLSDHAAPQWQCETTLYAMCPQNRNRLFLARAMGALPCWPLLLVYFTACRPGAETTMSPRARESQMK